VGATTSEARVAQPAAHQQPKRFHGSASLDPTRVGRDASRIADEVLSHLVGLVGSTAKVTLEIEVEIPSGAPDTRRRQAIVRNWAIAVGGSPYRVGHRMLLPALWSERDGIGV
jgi:hypothetical protein